MALDPTVPAGTLTIHQAVDDVHSVITGVRANVGGQTVDLQVPPPDADGASTVQLPAISGSALDLTVTAISPQTTVDRRFGETTTLPVAITELDSPALAHVPVVVPAQPPCRDDLLSVDGAPLSVAAGPSEIAALVAGQAVTVGTCDGAPVDLGAGSHVIASAAGLTTGIDLDRVVLSQGQAAPAPAPPAVTVQRDAFTRTAQVAACPNGCWLILGEGYNRGWSATADGHSLGAPRQIAGGFNGWWLPPSSTPVDVTMTWKPQTALNLALGLSAVAIVGCLALVWLGRRARSVALPAERVVVERHLLAPVSRRAALIVAPVTLVAATLLISWTFALAGVVLAALVLITRRPVLGALAAAVLAAGLGLIIWYRQRVDLYFVNAGWPGHFEDLHRWGLLVVVLLLTSVIVTPATDPARPRPVDGAP